MEAKKFGLGMYLSLFLSHRKKAFLFQAIFSKYLVLLHSKLLLPCQIYLANAYMCQRDLSQNKIQAPNRVHFLSRGEVTPNLSQFCNIFQQDTKHGFAL